MRTIATSAFIAMLAGVTAAQGQSPSENSVVPLDHFDRQYGFPTFPTKQTVQIPFVFNGPNDRALRINDVTKIPPINAATPPTAKKR
jgi:hypothetical protein